MSKPKFESEWEGFKGHVAVAWDKISEEDLLRIEGNFNDLVKLISDKYGETRSAVEQKLTALYDSYVEKRNSIKKGVSMMKEDLQHRSEQFAETIKQKATDFQNTAKERIQKIREESIDPAVQKSEDYIKMHPFTAVLGALGAGFLVGTIVGLLSGRKD